MSTEDFEKVLALAESGDPQSCLEVYSQLTDPALPGYGREARHPPRHYLKVAARADLIDALAILGVLVLVEGDEDYSQSDAVDMLELAYQRGSDLVIDLLATAGVDCETKFAEGSPLHRASSSSDHLILERIRQGYLGGDYTTLQVFNWLRLFRSADESNIKLLLQTALKKPSSLSFDHKRLVTDINRVVAISGNNDGSPRIYASEKKLFSPYLVKKVINAKFPDRRSQQGKERVFQYLSAMLKYFHDYFREIAVSQIRGELSQFNARWIASIPFEEDLDAYLTNRLSQKTKLALYKRPLNVIRHYGGWFHRISRQLKRLSTPYGDYRFDLGEKFKDLPAALFMFALVGFFGSAIIHTQLLKDPDFNICETTYAKETKLLSGGLWACAFDHQHRNSLRRENMPSFQRILEGLQSRFSEGVNTVLADEKFFDLQYQQFDIGAFSALFKPNRTSFELFLDEEQRIEYLKDRAQRKQEFLSSRITEGLVECSHDFDFTEDGFGLYEISTFDGSPGFKVEGELIGKSPPRSHCFWLTKPTGISIRDSRDIKYGYYLPDPDGHEVFSSKNENFKMAHRYRDYLHSADFPLAVILALVSSDPPRHQIVGYRFSLAAIQENIDARLKAIDGHIEPVNRMKWWTYSYWNDRDQKLKPVAFR